MAAKRQDERLKVNDPSLELLQLRDSLTADVATTLAGNTVVQEVIFGSMDARAMALLVQVLRVNSTIEALLFGETDISSDDITVLCETIATSNCQVDHLALTNEKKKHQPCGWRPGKTVGGGFPTDVSGPERQRVLLGYHPTESHR